MAVWILLLGLAALASAASSWDIRKLGGDEYVSVDNIRQFYKFGAYQRSGGAITLEREDVVMKLRVGSPDCTMNRVKFVFSKPVTEIDSKPFISRTDFAKLVDPVLRPSFIKNAGNFNTVILDPGHGGQDPGATNAFATEADLNLKLANQVRLELAKLGFKVLLTRNSDRFLSLDQRVAMANAFKGEAVFISLHFNSGGSHARGIETFTLSPPGVAHYGRGAVASDSVMRAGNAHDSANVALATAVHGMVTRHLGTNTFDRGIKRARYTVLTGIRHPAILFEGGFMSHPQESRLLVKPEYQTQVAKGIALAVEKYRRAVGRTAAAGSPPPPGSPRPGSSPPPVPKPKVVAPPKPSAQAKPAAARAAAAPTSAFQIPAQS